LWKHLKMEAKKSAGRKPIEKEEKVKPVVFWAKRKHHPAIVEKFKKPIENFEKKLDKEVKQ